MTAEIGILNKTSIVLAADSAVTTGRSDKVLYNANKLFPLSIHEPVGVMVFNSANWMGIPLEIIIKSYTKKLGEKSFSSLTEYRKDFVSFIKENYTSFVSPAQIKEFIEYRLYSLLEDLMDYCKQKLEETCSLSNNDISPEEKETLHEKIFFETLERIANYKTELLPDLKNYTLEEFKNDYRAYINKILPGFYSRFKLTRKPKYTNRIYKRLYHELIYSFSETEDYTGIVIAGYGTDEIFPTICDVKIGEIISNRLRYEFSQPKQISQRMKAYVRPYAQRDMIDTFFQGINHNLAKEMNLILVDELEKAIQKVIKKYPDINPSDIRPYFKSALQQGNKKLNEYTRKEFVSPVVTSIGFLGKEDLIELAESLINITSLKRKTSNHLQTVGGPVDVAVITKHEGFIWIKRKELINKDLNSIFYNRELKQM